MIKILAQRNTSFEIISYLIPIIEVILKNDKTLIYYLMKNESYLTILHELINRELFNIDIKKIVLEYSDMAEKDTSKIFPNEDTNNTQNSINNNMCYNNSNNNNPCFFENNYYMSINLPSIENQYSYYNEYYWLKQLPFNINIILVEYPGNCDYKSVLYSSLFEYDRISKRYYLSTYIDNNNLIVNINKDLLKFICNLGEKTIDQNARFNLQGIILNFDSSDFKNMIKLKYIKCDNTVGYYYRVEKDGFVIEMDKINGSSYALKRVYFFVKITPDK